MKHFAKFSILIIALAISMPGSAQGQGVAKHDRLEVGLSFAPGYGTYFSVKQASEDKVLHGMWLNMGLDLTWGDDRRRYGIRLHGMAAPTLSREGMDPGTKDYYSAGGVYAGFLARFGGFWLSPGLGVQFMSEMKYSSGTEQHEQKDGIGVTPEFNLGFGYIVDISRHLALNVNMEAGTSAFLLWRFQLNGGVQVRF